MIFNRVLPRFLPGLLQGKLKPAAKAVIFDQAVHMPFLYLPCFYFIREIGKNPDAVLGNIKEKFLTKSFDLHMFLGKTVFPLTCL